MTVDDRAGDLVLTALIALPSADVYGSDRQLLESIDGLRDAGWDVTLCLPASGSLVELVRLRGHPVLPVHRAKWGIDAPGALTPLCIEGPWLPAAIRPG